MMGIVGIIFVFVMVFGGYLLHGGSMGVIVTALPTELMTIFGGAIGAMIVGNSATTLKGVGKGLKQVFSGPKWKEQDFKDMLCLLFTITKMIKSKGILVIESHIEKPEESTIFQKYPRILADHFAVDFICDTLRMLSMNMDDPHQVFDAMESQLEKHHHEKLQPQAALQTMADGLPAIGIVAAVLGVIKTMSSVTEPPRSAGRHDRLGPGRYIPWRVPGLHPRRPLRRAVARDFRRRTPFLPDHPRRARRPPERQCPPSLRGDRAWQRSDGSPAVLLRT